MSQAATKESLAGKIVALNEQFLEHVQRAFARNSASLWLDAVADYREYAEAIAKELDKVPAAAPKAPVAEPNNIKPAFNFSSQPVSTTGFGWSSGAPASAAPATAPATAPASAPASAPATAPSAAKPDAEVVVLDDDDGSEPQIDEANKADVLFSKKVHLLTQDSETKKWKDKGTGTFSLRKSKDDGGGKRVAYIVFTAATGKVLINAPVVKGLKPIVNPKANSNVIMILISRDDSGVDVKNMHLFKCGSSELASELIAAVSAEA